MPGSKSVRPATQLELERLYAALAELDDPLDIAALLADMCTIREVEEMSQRLEVARLLSIGEPYTTITEKTGASATTIARVSKSLYHGAAGYARVLGLDS
ncbi:MAG: YerC/YecD family TrpR-related protein [Coriobacteriia bacterium]|nr:YerC/YecD family TrpR-related protein [Coriobacteriia bacterium]MCL2749938.1 YerC/YecD family TrpR-related protein [Coriobacteriia bacterium]